MIKSMNTSVISDINVNGKDIESSIKQSTLSMLGVLARTVSQMTINLVLNVQLDEHRWNSIHLDSLVRSKRNKTRCITHHEQNAK